MIRDMFKKRRVYLDYAAATPLSKMASSAMQLVMRESFANPSAIHAEGVKARRLIEESRKNIAKAVQIRPEFVTFTSGGTESNNIAIIGLVEQLHNEGREYSDMEILTTNIEHPSVTNAVLSLKERGVHVKFISVKSDGRINIDELKKNLTTKTVLLTLAYVNSEVGTIQPLHAIQKVLQEGEGIFSKKIFLHLDAAQAPLWVSCQFNSLGADLVSFDFGKCNGPKGVGALMRTSRTVVTPVLFGGGQESGLRSGTENVVTIVGGTIAFIEAQKQFKAAAERIAKIRDEAIKQLLAISTSIQLNGAEGSARVANNINISLVGIDTEYLTIVLDAKGFAVSTKSACAGAGGGESVVVKELTNDSVRAASTLRITLGPETSVQNLKELANHIKNYLKVTSELTQR